MRTNILALPKRRRAVKLRPTHPNPTFGRSSRAPTIICAFIKLSLRIRTYRKISDTQKGIAYFLVRTKGFEPTRCYPQEPETCASANFATSAFLRNQTSIGSISLFCKFLSLQSIYQAFPPLNTLPKTFPSSITSAALSSIP